MNKSLNIQLILKRETSSLLSCIELGVKESSKIQQQLFLEECTVFISMIRKIVYRERQCFLS